MTAQQLPPDALQRTLTEDGWLDENQAAKIAGKVLTLLRAAPQSASVPPQGFVLVPQAALDWLMGDGDSFEPTERQKASLMGPGSYWWRSQFRERIEAAPSHEVPREQEGPAGSEPKPAAGLAFDARGVLAQSSSGAFEAPLVSEIEEFRREHFIEAHPDGKPGLEPWAVLSNKVLNYLCYRACTPLSATGEQVAEALATVFCNMDANGDPVGAQPEPGWEMGYAAGLRTVYRVLKQRGIPLPSAPADGGNDAR